MSARWRGHTHPHLYEMINTGPGPAASGPQTSYWNSLTKELAEVDTDLNKALGDLNANWVGAASDNATTGITPLQQWAGDAQTGSRVMGISTEDQADFIATARAEMPKPVPVTTPAPSAWEVAGATGMAVLGNPGPAAVLAVQAVDHERQEAAANAAADKAVDTMNTYESNSTWNRNTLGTFVAPPDVVVATPPPGGGSGATGPIGSWIGTLGLTTSSSTATGTIRNPGAPGGSGGGSGTSLAPPPNVGGAPSGGNGSGSGSGNGAGNVTGVGSLPNVGGTDAQNVLPAPPAPPPPVPTPPPGPGPIPGPGPGPGPGPVPNPPIGGPGPVPGPGPGPGPKETGPLPGKGPGGPGDPHQTNRPNTGFGPRGTGGLPPAGFGPEGRGPGGGPGGPGGLNPESGRPSAAAQLGRGGATGVGGVGGPGGQAGSAGSGGGAGRGGAGMGGGPMGGGRTGSDDDEHFSPDYLLETTDVFGDDRMVSPAVIGEDPTLEEK